MTRKFYRTALALAALAGVSAASFGAQAAETLRIGKSVANNVVFALLDVGIEAGIFQKHGVTLEVSSFQGAAKMMQGLAVDAADIGLGGATDMALSAKGAPVKTVAAIVNSPELSAIVAANSRFKTVADLKGSVWMASTRASITGWLPAQIPLKMGWAPDAITIQTGASPENAVALIKTGQIDATATDTAVALQLERRGEMRVIVNFADIVPGFYQHAILVTDKVRAGKPEAVRGFLAGWLETVAYVKSHKDESVRIIAKTISLPPDIVATVYDGLMPKLVMDGRFTPASLDLLRASFVDMGLLDKQPDVAAVYTEEFLPRAFP